MTRLYQHNTLASIMNGLYKGTLPLSELLKHGDLGIGTLNDLDGELIVLDGKAYQARGDKTVHEVPMDAMIPYAAIVDHHASEDTFEVENLSRSDLLEMIEGRFISHNLFHSIKIKGNFSFMHVRMAPRQKPPYMTPFVEIAENQPEYEEAKVVGTIVGVWTPEIFHGASAAGYHLHFLSDDRTFGGHVLDFALVDGVVEIDDVEYMEQHFAIEDDEFLNASFDMEKLNKDIEIAE